MITGSAFSISLHPLPVDRDGVDHSVSLLKFWYTKQGIWRCFADVTNRGLDYVCNAGYTLPWTIHLFKQDQDPEETTKSMESIGIQVFFQPLTASWQKSNYQGQNHATGFTLLKLSSLYFIVVVFSKFTFLSRSYSNSQFRPSMICTHLHIYTQTHTLLIHSHTTTMALGQTLGYVWKYH